MIYVHTDMFEDYKNYNKNLVSDAGSMLMS